MHWIALSLLSAVFLGFYEIAKKASVRNNAVPPVLFFNVLTSALIYLPLILCSHYTPDLSLLQWIRGRSDWLGRSPKTGSEVSDRGQFVGVCLVCPQASADVHRGSDSGQQPVRDHSVRGGHHGENATPAQWVGVTVVVIAFYAFSSSVAEKAYTSTKTAGSDS